MGFSTLGTLGEVAVDVGIDTSDLKTGLDTAAAQARAAGAEIATAMSAGANGAGGMAKSTEELVAANQAAVASTQSMSEKLREFGGSLLQTGVAVSMLGIPLGELGLKSIQTAGMFEQAQIAFTTLLGSASKAQDFLKKLVEFAIATPFEIPGLMDASKRLLAMGFSIDQLLPMLRTLGDAVSAVGAGDAGIKRITLAFGEMQARGTVAMKEMNQLAMLGIPAMDILAKKLDMTHAELMSAIKKRTIDAATAIPLLLEGLNEKFGGMMQAQATTLLGMWSNVADALTKTLNAIGQQILPFAKGFVDQMYVVLSGVQSLAEMFGRLPEPVKVFILSLAGITAIAGPLLVAIGGISLALAGVASEVIVATGGIALIIPALAALWNWVSQYMPEIKAIWDEVFTDMSDFGRWGWDKIQEAWTGISTTFSNLASIILPPLKLAFEAILAVVVLMAAPLVVVAEGMIRLTQISFDDTVQAVKSIYNSWVQWANFAPTLEAIWGSLKNFAVATFSAIWDGLMRIAGPAIQPIIEDWSLIKTTLIAIWSGIWAAVGVIWGGLTQSILDLWNAIKTAAIATWSFITDQIKAFLAAANQIPGLGNLLNADFQSIAAGARTAADAHKQLAQSTTPLPNILGTMKQALGELGQQHDAVEPKVRKHAQTTKDYSDVITQATPPTLDFSAAVATAQKAFDAYMTSVTKGDLKQALDDLDRSMRGLTGDTTGWGEKLASIPPVMNAVYTAGSNTKAMLDQYTSGLKTLGLTLVDTAETKAKKLTDAFNAILTSGQATPQILYQAWDQYRAKFVDAMREMAKEADLRTDDIATFFRKKWAGIAADSTNLFVSLDKDLNNLGDIFASKFDMRGKSMKSVMDQIAYAMQQTWRQVLTDIEKQFAKMIGDMLGSVVQFVEQGIKKELIGSMTQFDSKLSDVDTHLGDMIVKLTGGQLKSAVGAGANDAASKGAGGIAGASASIQGLIPALGLVVQAIDAVFSALSYFQGRRVEQDVGRIEVTTRGILNNTGYTADNTNSLLSTLQDVRQAVEQTNTAIVQALPWWSSSLDKLTDIADWSHQSLMELMQIHTILGSSGVVTSSGGNGGGATGGGNLSSLAGTGVTTVIEQIIIQYKYGTGDDIVDQLISTLEARGIHLVGG